MKVENRVKFGLLKHQIKKNYYLRLRLLLKRKQDIKEEIEIDKITKTVVQKMNDFNFIHYLYLY